MFLNTTEIHFSLHNLLPIAVFSHRGSKSSCHFPFLSLSHSCLSVCPLSPVGLVEGKEAATVASALSSSRRKLPRCGTSSAEHFVERAMESDALLPNVDELLADADPLGS